MFLHELNETNERKFKKLNKILKRGYDVTVSMDTDLNSLYEEYFALSEGNRKLYETESRLHQHNEYSRNLLLAESIELQISEKEKGYYDHMFGKMLSVLAGYLAESIKSGELASATDVTDIYVGSGDKKYHPALIENIMKRFMIKVGDIVNETYSEPLTTMVHTLTAQDTGQGYGNDVIDAFFARKSSSLLEQYSPSMLEAFNKVLGK